MRSFVAPVLRAYAFVILLAINPNGTTVVDLYVTAYVPGGVIGASTVIVVKSSVVVRTRADIEFTTMNVPRVTSDILAPDRDKVVGVKPVTVAVTPVKLPTVPLDVHIHPYGVLKLGSVFIMMEALSMLI